MSDLTDAPDLNWPADPESGHDLRHRRRGRIAALLTSLVVVLALAGTGLGLTLRFQDRALPGSTVAGRSVTGMTAEEIAALVAEDASGLEVTVTTDGAEATVPLADTGVSIDADATAARAVAESPGPVAVLGSFFEESPFEPVVQVDEDAVTAFASSLVASGEQSPVNAQLVKDTSDADAEEDPTAWAVEDGAAGRAADAESLGADIAAAATALDSIAVAAEVTTVEPAITTAEAQEAHDALQARFEAPVELVGPEKTYEADADDRADWFSVATDEDAGTITVGADSAAVSEYVSEIADEVAVKAKNGIEQVDPAGVVVTAVAEPKDGLEVVNTDALVTELTAAMTAGDAFSGEFVTEVVAATMDQVDAPADPATEEDDAPAQEEPPATPTGEKWIDINLANKTVTAYQGDTVVFGPVSVVTGDSSENNQTDVGSYEVYLKHTEQDMTNASRYPEGHPKHYFTADVPWVMYFNGGEGFHGAPWRDSFGYEGSHGCVNMTVSDAKWLWDFAPMGTRVEVHY